MAESTFLLDPTAGDLWRQVFIHRYLPKRLTAML
jgi:hypothetical protein